MLDFKKFWKSKLSFVICAALLLLGAIPYLGRGVNAKEVSRKWVLISEHGSIYRKILNDLKYYEKQYGTSLSKEQTNQLINKFNSSVNKNLSAVVESMRKVLEEKDLSVFVRILQKKMKLSLLLGNSDIIIRIAKGENIDVEMLGKKFVYGILRNVILRT